RSVKDFRDRIRANVSVKKQNLLLYIALFLLFVVAVLIRLSPLINESQLIKAFDPWIQYYNAQYLSEHSLYEYFTWHDIQSWYPSGIARFGLKPGLTFTTVAIYKSLVLLGFPVTLYDVCFFFPAFMGGLTVIAMYFLGKEISGSKCGLFAAFFLALSTGYIQRTVAGFFDNETVGVFATIMTFLFFIKAIRTGKITHSILGGVFLGYLTLSWGGYQFTFYAIPLITLLLILLNKYNQNVLIAYAGVQGAGLFISALYVKFKFDDLFSSLEIGGVFLFTILLLIYHLLFTKKRDYPKLYNIFMNLVKWAIIPGGIILVIIVWVNPDLIPLGLGSRFQSILNPLLRNEFNLVASVAEHMPSSWSIFYYNTLIPLMLIPLGIYFAFKRFEAADIFLIVFILLIFYFTGSMIRIILLFAPAAALVGAYGLTNVLKIFSSFYNERSARISRKRKKLMRRKKTIGKSEVYGVYLLVGFLCIAQVVHATDISTNQLAYSQLVAGGVLHDWEESLSWMRNNLDGSTVVVSWWDYGYWLTPIGNVTTVNDNATFNGTRIGLTGMSFMQTNELYSAEILRFLKADYVLVFFGYLYDGLGGDEGKWQWMLRICNDNYQKYINLGLEKDNWKENSVFDESEYVNRSSGRYRDKWFQSQLVRLMFYGLPTSDPSDQYPQGSIIQNYISGINNQKDDEGNPWATHIPENGNYDFKIFQPEYFSQNGLVKLYKVDYTALESDFSIKNPKVFDKGYGIVDLENTGSKDLLIKNVEVNGKEYGFTMGSSINDNILSVGESDILWIDLKSNETDFKKDTTAKIDISAESDALGGKKYTFTESTSNLFVKEGEEGKIRINRENSIVVYNTTTELFDCYIEVENTGNIPLVIDNFFINSEETQFTEIRYLAGSSILRAGEKANVYLSNSPIPFSPIGSYNIIGVSTRNNVTDRTIFSANRKTMNNEYHLSIINEQRVLSPELNSLSELGIRKFVQPTLENSYAYTYNNRSSSIYLKVKNTGDRMYNLDELSILDSTNSLIDNDKFSWSIMDSDPFVDINEEKMIKIDIDSGVFNVNDEVGVNITASEGGTKVASDVGFFYTIKPEANINILETHETFKTSQLYNNGSVQLLIKNTGNQPLDLDLNNIKINDTTPLDLNIIYGDSTLNLQETAIITFNVNQSFLDSTQTKEILVKVNTNKTASDEIIFTVDYNIAINESSTNAIEDNDLELYVNNYGLQNVTINNIFINQTKIGLGNFTGDFDIQTDGYTQLTMTMTTLEQILGSDISIGDHLYLYVNTSINTSDEFLLAVS
ncbi:MAG: hypothetical protein GF317_12080, partial [Candidatus Lokiarchaeota archaeon]|nr:hypothetical protein [Candidatus Lokiarchaeota archaeon]MBD3200382.1 hypothetical protein [Candidatus Lokiarchaeota archaeon]